MTPPEFREITDLLTALWPKLDMNPEQANIWRMVLAHRDHDEAVRVLRDWKANETRYPSPAAIGHRFKSKSAPAGIQAVNEGDFYRQRWGEGMTDDEIRLRVARWAFERSCQIYGSPDQALPRSIRIKFEDWQREVARQGFGARNWEGDGENEAASIIADYREVRA